VVAAVGQTFRPAEGNFHVHPFDEHLRVFSREPRIILRVGRIHDAFLRTISSIFPATSGLIALLFIMTPLPSQRAFWAYLTPFGLFMLLLMSVGAVRKLGDLLHSSSLWLTVPEFWIYPLQTVVCGAALIYWRRDYPRETGGWRALGIGAAIGAVVFVVWVSPQMLFHQPPRTEGGFDPTKLLSPTDPGGGTALYFGALAMRFVRLVVIVSLVEEIFWRGFLMRYLIKEDFTHVPFGAYTPLSFGATALGFMLEHQAVDYPAALVCGVLYNLTAVLTRSLPACVLAHALTNLLLGIYVVQTRQWGFW
jgi:CAAX prenyl protease-like protein